MNEKEGERTLFENIRATFHTDTTDSEGEEDITIQRNLKVGLESHEMRLESWEEG